MILARTELLPGSIRLNRPWVALKLRQFITQAGNLKGVFNDGDGLRQHLRVSDSVDLIAVFNGHDDRLERFWGNARRRAILAQLAEAGVRAITGPTFSVLGESGDHPASHNVVMLQRHHQVAFEAQREGLVVIPNIYWRSKSDLSRWTNWLERETEVVHVSRDFSRTKHRGPFEEELNGLLTILEGVTRPLHVLLVGVAEGNVAIARDAFASLSVGWSVISGRPLIAATRGRLLPDPTNGERRESTSDLSVQTLMRENVRRFEAAVGGQYQRPVASNGQGNLFG